jgi:prepilin-type N-terminal cleavage/methylation domain-containing protein
MHQTHCSTCRNDRSRNESGFTLLEILVVVGLIGVLAGMAIMVSPSFSRNARADAGTVQVLDAIRSAREVAISQRRNVELRFVAVDSVGLNAVQTVRRNLNPAGFTTLRTVRLENRMELRLDSAIPTDTPDKFRKTGTGWTTAVAFGPKGSGIGSAWGMFTSEGTFVDADGDPLNGTAFLAIENQKNSLRAITVMGSTALIRSWRWNGKEWVD